MRNKRTTPRKIPSERIEIFDLNSEGIIGQLANITSSGLMLIGPVSVAPGTLFQLQISLPSPVNGVETIEFGAECLWCQRAKRVNSYWTGMQIIDVSESMVEIIERLIESWQEHS